MRFRNRFFPWYREEDDVVKDARTDRAVERAKANTANIRRLAQSYQASGILVKVVKHHEIPDR